jgi:hypothetical protein
MMLSTKLAAFMVHDGGALVARNVNFLAVWGLLLVQACSGGVAAGFVGVTCCSTKTMLGLRRILL